MVPVKRLGWLSIICGIVVLGVVLFGRYYLKPQPTLVVGVDPTFSPFETRGADGQFRGFDIDLAGALGKLLKCKIELKEIPFRELLPSLQNGTVQLVISGMPIRADRQELVDFSQPYYDATQVVVMRKADLRQPTRPEDLATWRLGVQVGTTGAFEAESLKGSAQDGTLREMDQLAELFGMLRTQEVDALITDRQVAARYEARDPELKVAAVAFWEEHYGVAVQKGQMELLAKVDLALVGWLQSPDYERALTDWFGPR